jgi:CrcB protein
MSASGFLVVGIGAMLGAWLRWLLGIALNLVVPALPLGTLLANLSGGFMIGVAVQYLAHNSGLPLEVRLFVITGFLGALTTFSAFSAESVALLSRGQYAWAALHTGAHLFGSLAMTALGIASVRMISGVNP